MLPRFHPPNDVARAGTKDGMDIGGASAVTSIRSCDEWCERSVGSVSSCYVSDCPSMLSTDFLLVEDIMNDDEHLEEIQGPQDCSITEAIFEDCSTPPVFGEARNHTAFSSKSRTPPLKLFLMLPDDLICEIFTYLDVNSLSVVRLVSRRLKEQGSKDESGWPRHCECLWRDKVFVSKPAEGYSNNAIDAYRMSIEDGNRQEISQRELCYDSKSGAGTVWYFRFKESAGAAWTSFDPWHAGLDCRRMVFLSDGTIKELASDPAFPGSFRIEYPFMDVPDHHRGDFEDLDEGTTHISMKWRFLSSPMDMSSRPPGAYLRLTVADRDVPTYIVQRSPTGNWGFMLENCWGVFASFPLPLKVDTVGRTPPLHRTRMRLRRINGGEVRWLNVDQIEGERDENERMEVDTEGTTGYGHLLGDNALLITSRYQWREALLYNYGSVTLPEGEAACAEFDRTFASFRSPIESLDSMVR